MGRSHFQIYEHFDLVPIEKSQERHLPDNLLLKTLSWLPTSFRVKAPPDLASRHLSGSFSPWLILLQPPRPPAVLLGLLLQGLHPTSLHASFCLECYSSKYPLYHYSSVTFSKRSSLTLYRKFHLPHLSLCYPLHLSTSNILCYIFDCCVYLLLPFHQNLSPGKTGTFVCSVQSFITSSLNNAWHRGSA